MSLLTGHPNSKHPFSYLLGLRSNGLVLSVWVLRHPSHSIVKKGKHGTFGGKTDGFLAELHEKIDTTVITVW